MPRGVKFAHMALLLFSALLAFLILRATDEEIILGSSARIEVTRSDNSVSSVEVVSAVESFADAHNVNVGHEAADLNDPDNLRHLYLAVGDSRSPSASWLADGYPNFSRNFRTEAQPLDEISRMDPRGAYLIFGGSPEVAGELVAEFERLGFSGRVIPAAPLSGYIDIFGSEAVLWCFLIVLLASVTVVGSSVVLNAKAYGVLRLQGKSFAQILGRDMAQLGAFWVRAAAIIAVGVVACLAAYNGLNRIHQFGLIAAGFLAVFVALALATHVVALALTYRTRIVHAIKGEVSATLAMVCVYAIRIPAALLALTIVVSAYTTFQDVAERQASRNAFAKVGDASSLLLYANPTDRNQEREAIRTVGSWIQRSQSQGEVILALHSDMTNFTPLGERVPEHDVLIVNEEYLTEQTVLDASGHRLRGVRDPGIKAQILIPESLSGDADRLTASFTKWLKFQAEIGDTSLDAAQVKTIETRSGQTVFTYGSGMYTGRPADALVRDPIIVVVPGSSEIFGVMQYDAYATQSGIIFKDPDDVREAMSTDVGQYVVAMRPVAQHAADEYQDLIREFRIDLFNIAVALTVLLITAISTSLIYRRKNAQALFVKHISGWTFVGAYRSLLALEGVLALALFGWSAWNTWSAVRALRELEVQGMPPIPGQGVPLGGWTPAAMLTIVVLSVVIIVAVLAGSHRRLIRQRAVEE